MPPHSTTDGEAVSIDGEAVPNDLVGRARSARLFFALWPDAATARLLEEAGRQAQEFCGGRRMRCETLHITLAFLGEIAVDRIALLREVAAGLHAPFFTLRLDKLGCWRHIVWAGCAETPPELSSLAGQLASSLRAAGFLLEERPFAAHVTLLRNARCDLLLKAQPSLPAIDWQAAEFVLVQSQSSATGVGYTPIGRWPLAPGID